MVEEKPNVIVGPVLAESESFERDPYAPLFCALANVTSLVYCDPSVWAFSKEGLSRLGAGTVGSWRLGQGRVRVFGLVHWIKGRTRLAWLGELDLQRFAETMMRIAKQRHFTGFSLVVRTPYHLPVVKYLPPHVSVVYFAADDYRAYPGLSEQAKRRITQNEKIAAQQGIPVVVVGTTLYEWFNSLGAPTNLIPTGVDYELFSRIGGLSSNEVPSDLKALPRPIIGYIGMINERLDLNLIKAILEAHPEWSVVLIGAVYGTENEAEIRRTLQDLKLYKSFHLLEFRNSQAEVARAIASFDVSLMPYDSHHLFVKSMSPTKLYQYLAVGKPIVSTDFADARTFVPFLRIGRNADEFIAQIELALQESLDKNRARIREAGKHTYEERALDWLKLLVKYSPAQHEANV